MSQNFERLLNMSYPGPLQLLKDEHKTNQEKIADAYRRLNEKLDMLIARRKKKSKKTGT